MAKKGSAPVEESTETAPSRLIKRYANRKLYDTEASSYVTLDDIAEMIREGGDVRVIDNRSKEDLTAVTLAQIIFEQQKSRRRVMPLSALKNIITGSSELFQRLGQPVSQLRGEATRQVERLKRGKDEVADGAEGALVEEPSRSVVLEVVNNLQRAVDEMQKRVDERVRDAVDALTHVPDLQKDTEELSRRLDALEAQVETIANKLG